MIIVELTHRVVATVIVLLRGICRCTQQRLVEHVVTCAIGCIHLAKALLAQKLLASRTHYRQLKMKTDSVS